MNDEKFLLKAIEQAKKSVGKGGFPAGAVLVKNNKIIAKTISIGNKLNDLTAHAESVCIRKASKKLKTDLKGAILYASLQPCAMCFSAANWAGISKIIFAAKKTAEMVKEEYYEGRTDINKLNEENNRKIELIYFAELESKSLEVVSAWKKTIQ